MKDPIATASLGPIKIEVNSFLDRLKVERQELQDKYQKLVHFIHKESAQFTALSEGQQDLLRQQANIMSQYVSILTRRLELIEKEGK